MNTYCDDCKRCTGGDMRKSDVPGWDDHNRCWECEATIQAGMAEADAMISDLRAERDALREQVEIYEVERDVTLDLAEACANFVHIIQCKAKDGSGRSMVQIAPDEDIREFVLGTIEDLIVETGRTSVAMVATDAAISATEVKP